jgi:hypothetical protein
MVPLSTSIPGPEMNWEGAMDKPEKLHWRLRRWFGEHKQWLMGYFCAVFLLGGWVELARAHGRGFALLVVGGFLFSLVTDNEPPPRRRTPNCGGASPRRG